VKIHSDFFNRKERKVRKEVKIVPTCNVTVSLKKQFKIKQIWMLKLQSQK